MTDHPNEGACHRRLGPLATVAPGAHTVKGWGQRVTEWEARWARLDPPATMRDLLDMHASGRWATPAHQAAYEEWAPEAGRHLVEVIRDETGIDLLAGLEPAPVPPTA